MATGHLKDMYYTRWWCGNPMSRCEPCRTGSIGTDYKWLNGTFVIESISARFLNPLLCGSDQAVSRRKVLGEEMMV